MPRTIQQTVTFRVPPDQLFDTYLSSRKHTVATGAKAVMSRPWAPSSWPMRVT